MYVGAKATTGSRNRANIIKFMSEILKLRKNGIPITSVTLWGISDTDSWISSDYPLIFNDDLSRKPAFDGMIEAVKNQE